MDKNVTRVIKWLDKATAGKQSALLALNELSFFAHSYTHALLDLSTSESKTLIDNVNNMITELEQLIADGLNASSTGSSDNDSLRAYRTSVILVNVIDSSS